MSARRRTGSALWLSLLALLAACDGDDARFLTPATTFQHYRQSLIDADAEAAWACLAPGYRRQIHDDDAVAYGRFLAGPPGRALSRQVAGLQIVEEVEINDRVGYLQFDPSTVPPGSSAFFYFLKEPPGWQITTHMDSLFRAELERAVEKGDLPLSGAG